MEPFSFGQVDNIEDNRDVSFSSLPVMQTEIVLPDEYLPDYLYKLPIPNQKKIGSCGGQASGTYKVIQEFLENGTMFDASRRWIYAHAWQRNKKLSGYIGEGSTSRDLMWVIANLGVAPASLVPNNSDLTHEEYVDISQFPKEAYTEALKYKSGGFAFVNWYNEIELKTAIIKTGGVMIAVNLGDEWWTPSWSPHDIMPVRPPKVIVSGHFIVLDSWRKTPAGVEFEGTVYQFPNSWSSAWADLGRNTMVYNQYVPFIKDAVCMTDIPDDILTLVRKLPSKKDFAHFFDTSGVLKQGSTGSEVEALQTFLLLYGFMQLDPSIPLGVYGSITRDAVSLFQQTYRKEILEPLSLKFPTGVAAAMTLKKINSLIAARGV